MFRAWCTIFGVLILCYSTIHSSFLFIQNICSCDLLKQLALCRIILWLWNDSFEQKPYNFHCFRSIGERFDLGKSALYYCALRVVRVLCSISSDIIRWPTNAEINDIKNNFYNSYGFPDVVGAVDGAYIYVTQPKVIFHHFILDVSSF